MRTTTTVTSPGPKTSAAAPEPGMKIAAPEPGMGSPSSAVHAEDGPRDKDGRDQAQQAPETPVPAADGISIGSSELAGGGGVLRVAVAAAVMLCSVPVLFVAAGAFSGVLGRTACGTTPVDQDFQALAGPFVHTILEWSSIMSTLFAFGVSVLHFHIRRNLLVPVLFAILLAGGAMDAVHVLVADRLVAAPANNNNFVPFTWAASRTLNALMAAGFSLFVVRRGSVDLTVGLEARGRGYAIIGVICVVFAILLASTNAALASVRLPQQQYPDSVITRPFDVGPLLLYGIALAGAEYMRRSARQGVAGRVLLDCFSYSLLFSVATQVYMAFGSAQLFDSAFNVAHFLKILSFLVPSFGLVTDISVVYSAQQHRTFRAKLALRSRAEALMDEFVTTTTHDLGTPLMAFSAGCDLMRDMDLPDEARKLLSTMTSAVEMMTMTRQNVLSYARILEGKELHIDESQIFAWEDLLERCIQLILLNGQMRHGAVEVRAVLDRDLAGPMQGEAAWMQQMLVNLVSNAAKFTHRGYIEVRVRSDPSDHPGCIVVEVIDTGPGVPDFMKPRLFNRFVQMDGDNGDAVGDAHNITSPVHRRLGGTGVGLFSVSRQASALGGAVGVKDNPDPDVERGSVFWFTVPIRRFSRAAHRASVPRAAPALWESHPHDSRLLLLHVFDGTHSDSPRSEAVTAAGAGRRRSSPGVAASDSAEAVSIEVGTGSVLAPDAIVATTTHEAATGTPRSSASNDSSAVGGARGLNVLVVDDVAMNRKVLTMLLRKAGVVHIATAVDGSEGLAAMQARAFDLVLCDIQMPVCDGVECAERYRSWEAGPAGRAAAATARRTPTFLVAVSALDASVRERAMKAGFDDVQPKPLPFEQLKSLLREAVARASTLTGA